MSFEDVCLSIGMWRANGNPNPCTNLDEILHTPYPTCPRACPPLPGHGEPETLQAEGHIF